MSASSDSFGLFTTGWRNTSAMACCWSASASRWSVSKTASSGLAGKVILPMLVTPPDSAAVENTDVDDGGAGFGAELPAANDEIELRHLCQIPSVWAITLRGWRSSLER